MKLKTITLLAIFLSIFCIVKSQDFYTNKVWITVIDSSVISNVNGKNVLKNEQIQRTFEQYQVYEYKQVFPFAKTSSLRNVYELTFNGKQENLIKDISSMRSSFSNCELVYKPQPLYDPADWGWWNTVTNNITNDWLWYLVKIKAGQAWDITRGDSTVRIAVVDVDGFDYDHLELQTKIDPLCDFYDYFYHGKIQKNKGSHGTSVASLLAGETVDAGEIPLGDLASIGYKSKMMVSTGSLAACLYASTVLNAEILSISWYGSCSASSTYLAAEQEILNNGTIIVKAAGNGSGYCNGQRLYPFSGYEDGRVIVVSSTDYNDNHTNINPGGGTNSHYPEVDICAPGYRLIAANLNNTYSPWGGTSQSTPIVAGVCALMKSVNRCLTPEDAQYIIKTTADPIADAHLYPGLVGAGRVNAYKAVLMTQSLANTNTITSNQVWNTKKRIYGNVIINPSVTLTITNIVEFCPDVSITIQPNGRLNMDNGSHLTINPNTKTILKSNSSLIMSSGSNLIIQDGAQIIVESGATFTVKQGANLTVQGSGRLVIKSGAYLCVESGANIKLQDFNSVISMQPGAIYGANPANPSCGTSAPPFTGNGCIPIYTQNVYIQNETISANRYIAGQNIYVGKKVTILKPQGPVFISGNAHVVFDAAQNVIFEDGFECSSTTAKFDVVE